MSASVYIVATPIGNLADISLRAIEILKDVDCIFAEDKRESLKLLNHLGIQKPLRSLHKFNENSRIKEITSWLNNDQSVAIISDAGTPVISDPGGNLIGQLLTQGYTVSPIPGCCAAIAALCCSGLPADNFFFQGFLPAKPTSRAKRLAELAKYSVTQIFYEAPHRIEACLRCLVAEYGDERQAFFAREITKKFETCKSGTLAEIADFVANDKLQQKGEIVLVVSGAEVVKSKEVDDNADRVLRILLTVNSLRDASDLAARILHLPKRLLYEYGLKLTARK